MFNQQDLDKVPLTCLRLLICLIGFKPKAEYLPGKEIVVDDTLSRNPCEITKLPWQPFVRLSREFKQGCF